MIKQHVAELQSIAKQMRREIVEMITHAKSGHPGGSLSAVEILVTLFFDVMRHDPANPKWPDRDRFILSKGHAAPVLYSVMAECDTRPRISSTRCGNSALSIRAIRMCGSYRRSKHPRVARRRPFDWNWNVAGRKARSTAFASTCPGRGEVQEGQIWESAMFGGDKGVDNLVAILDYNHIQLDGFVNDIMRRSCADKWRAFNWHALRWTATAFQRYSCVCRAATTKGRPTIVVAHTIKGKGVSSWRTSQVSWHRATEEEMEKALLELA